MKAGCKSRELCQLQRSAKVRSSALLAISGFLPPSQNVRNICLPLFLEIDHICINLLVPRYTKNNTGNPGSQVN